MNDVELAALLARGADAPYPGAWRGAPFAERTVDGVRYALVALDPGVSALGLRRDDGSLWGLPEDGIPWLLNSSAEAFVACASRYREAAARVDAAQAPDDGAPRGVDDGSDDAEEAEEAAERAADALTDALVARFAEIDAPAVADENSFWSVAAEELGYALPA